MSTVTFDTLELVEILVKNGVEQKQSEAIVRVIEKSHAELATKQDIKDLTAHIDLKFQQELNPINIKLAVSQWMLGVLLAGVISLVLKAFF